MLRLACALAAFFAAVIVLPAHAQPQEAAHGDAPPARPLIAVDAPACGGPCGKPVRAKAA